ncbi:protein CRABS CLAW-like [Rhododendron vialii]|uniref:protein CRABS CLAW-like n=1 Tax=Rhododendron vialii TaxID=182163 RepID=UPI00265E896E|nr:protein CRABS CLAW-like [Rhododendron vialii]
MAYQAYVLCDYCNKVLGVEIPSEESRNPVPVECQSCSNVLFVQKEVNQGDFFGSTFQTGQSSSSTSSALTQQQPSSSQEHFTEKSPETYPRPLTKYNGFIREEVKRIKDANPGISHSNAFSTAAKNCLYQQLSSIYDDCEFYWVANLQSMSLYVYKGPS